nr:hypothetical protein [Paracoccus marinus]
MIRKNDGSRRYAAFDDVLVGAILWNGPDERVPIDVEIVEGATDLDRSLVTGDAARVAPGPGDTLEARALRTSECASPPHRNAPGPRPRRPARPERQGCHAGPRATRPNDDWGAEKPLPRRAWRTQSWSREQLLGRIAGLKIEDRPLTLILGRDANSGAGMAQVAPLVLGLRHLDGGDDAGNFLLRPLKPVGAPQPVDVPAVAFKDGLPQAVTISG